MLIKILLYFRYFMLKDKTIDDIGTGTLAQQ